MFKIKQELFSSKCIQPGYILYYWKIPIYYKSILIANKNFWIIFEKLNISNN